MLRLLVDVTVRPLLLCHRRHGLLQLLESGLHWGPTKGLTKQS